jgi:chorismate synthase
VDKLASSIAAAALDLVAVHTVVSGDGGECEDRGGEACFLSQHVGGLARYQHAEEE